MSLDNCHECSSCGKHTAIRMWMQLFGSMDHADVAGGPDFLSAITPGPALVKVEVCVTCGSMKAIPINQYSAEDLAAIEKRSAEQAEKLEATKKLGALFGPKVTE